MNLLSGASFDGLFDSFEMSAFHLELRDWYFTSTEDESLKKWLKGEPDDYEWFQPWLDRITRLTSEGKSFQRIRVITEPISGYIRYEHFDAHLNTNAGEDIRWLPRHMLPEGITFPHEGLDFWLFDDKLAAFNHFDEDGDFLGAELVSDPQTVRACGEARDLLWPLSIPHSDYKPV